MERTKNEQEIADLEILILDLTVDKDYIHPNSHRAQEIKTMIEHIKIKHGR